jgi:cobalt-precorrin 5A hydrolase
MRLAIVSLTKNAAQLAARILETLPADNYSRFDAQGAAIPEAKCVSGEFAARVGDLFAKYEGIIFIMACGIVVRSIAPFLKDKKNDPAVLVVDEKGEYVISLLSGHYGGANRLARQVAEQIGAQAVITTATDLNQAPAFDLFAREQECVIENESELKELSAALVNGETVCFHTPYRVLGEFSGAIRRPDQTSGDAARWAVVLDSHLDNQPQAQRVLYLRPHNLILGIGCKKGTSKGDVQAAITAFLRKNRRSFLSVKKIVSIEHKAAEAGILEFCRERGLTFQTLSVAELLAIEPELPTSAFVKETVGVGNVAEACALLGGDRTRLIGGKTIYPGITLALAEEEREYRL